MLDSSERRALAAGVAVGVLAGALVAGALGVGVPGSSGAPDGDDPAIPAGQVVWVSGTVVSVDDDSVTLDGGDGHRVTASIAHGALLERRNASGAWVVVEANASAWRRARSDRVCVPSTATPTARSTS